MTDTLSDKPVKVDIKRRAKRDLRWDVLEVGEGFEVPANQRNRKYIAIDYCKELGLDRDFASAKKKGKVYIVRTA